MKTFFIALRAVLYMTAFFFAWGWAALRLRALDPRLGVALPGWAAIPGMVLMVPGAILGLWCAAEFVTRGRGTPALFDSPREFVAVGPYRFVRNPMYVGGLTFLAGFGLYERSISILIMTALAFLAVELLVLLHEEPTLKKKFGATYDAYCRDVSRWLPRRPKAE